MPSFPMALPPVQAGSLASVVEIADDPPAQLHGNLGAVQEPLVLYIARVPGSRDVFLTTMRPQEKVVTAQDIESSLYYVHVDCEKDKELLLAEDDIGPLLLEEDEEDVARFAVYPSKAGPQSRKPVLPPRRSTREPEMPPEILPHFHPTADGLRNALQVGRKPVGQGSSKAIHKSMGVSSTFDHRRLLGPRPIHGRMHSVDNGALALGNVPQRQNIDTRRLSEQPTLMRPPLPLRPYEQNQRNLEEIYRANSTYTNEIPLRIEEDRSSLGSESYGDLSGQRPSRESSLTLIRRYDRLQSNVGKIMASNLPGDPLVLDLIGIGYSKFNDQGSGGTNGKSFEELEQSVYRCLLRTTTNPKQPAPDLRAESHNFPPAHRPGLRASLDLRRRSHLRSSSSESASDSKPSNPKGYTFRSPWNGTCDFVTGVAGRSLKCRHSHPSTDGHAVEISELRFNLPSSKTFTPAPKSLTPNTPRESKRSSFFAHNHRRPSSLDQMEADGGSKIELEDRLDLSLGQEHAGGGFGGKQAKLGKLIVEQEGLQMLDLVVAANMALWWRVYDRTI